MERNNNVAWWSLISDNTLKLLTLTASGVVIIIISSSKLVVPTVTNTVFIVVNVMTKTPWILCTGLEQVAPFLLVRLDVDHVGLLQNGPHCHLAVWSFYRHKHLFYHEYNLNVFVICLLRDVCKKKCFSVKGKKGKTLNSAASILRSSFSASLNWSIYGEDGSYCFSPNNQSEIHYWHWINV